MKVCLQVQLLTSSTKAKCFARFASCRRWAFLSWRESISSCFLCRVSWSCRHTEAQLQSRPQRIPITWRSRAFPRYIWSWSTNHPTCCLACAAQFLSHAVTWHRSYIAIKTYHIVDFYGIFQGPALALGNAVPQGSVLCRWVTCFSGRAN